MAMNLVAAKAAIELAVKNGMIAKYGSDVVAADMQKLAEGISPGIIAALQHILDNAVTSVQAERIV